jgi:membrane fusion protein (multidrug efflux system)
MASRTLYLVVAVAGIAIASGTAWWIQAQPKGQQQVGVLASSGGAPAPARAGSAPQGAASGPRATGVEVARVETMRLQDDAQAVGSLRSRQNVMLRPEVAGRVQKLGFADGARVRRGQVLVQLDDALQRAEESQAQAQVSIARANYKRNQELVAQSFVAQRVLDESAASLQVAEAQLSLAQARLARMRIVAPFDGTVGLRSVNVGDYVKDGADLVNLEDLSTMLVDFRLPERYQTRIKPGQSVELLLDALPGRRFQARVQAIDPLLDANGRSVSVRAALPNADGALLRPGMFARVTTVFGVNDTALVVPEEAVVPQGGRQYVIRVVEPSAVPGTATAALSPEVKTVSLRQEVKLGVRRAGKVEIAEGLSEGQTVVVAGQQRLQRDGTPVRVVEINRAGNSPAGASPAARPASGAAASR